MIGSDAFSALKFAANYSKQHFSYSTVKFTHESVYAGDTTPSSSGSVSLSHIGRREFLDHMNEGISDVDFVASIVIYEKSDDNLCSVLAMNYLACVSSSRYYGNKTAFCDKQSSYWTQCHEMAAQYIGLSLARDYLESIDGLGFDVNKVMCEYQAKRLKGADFIKRAANFETVDQILSEYEKQFPSVVRQGHSYRYDGSNYESVIVNGEQVKIEIPKGHL